ncbi:uncharacterized protein LOC125190820 isoform X2 [Salvia hispanica]|uniref:uncharacterized protein LOC125187148 isoform X2 n=1 Tax=Salvia hispanica TaxID=49212 RepID=UPI002008F934|nr:uncharacterized protein LOC125187148 isoform X2 [Salvia hispanica]XP_047944181.1 uncharacterized protein LOC125190820 isoform X2 [Salvia hispanica]
MTDPDHTLNLTPAKRVECEEPPIPQRLQQSPSKESESDYDWDSDPAPPYDPDWDGPLDTQVIQGEEIDEDLTPLPDDVRNSEDYNKYLQLITDTEGYDCGSFDFSPFDLKIIQAPQQLIDTRGVHVQPSLQDYNNQHEAGV